MVNDSSTWQPQSTNSWLLKLAAMALPVLALLACLAVLIVWLVFHPKNFLFSVEDAYITGYSLSQNHLNATYNFHVQAHNLNKKVSANYLLTEVRVQYNEQMVAIDMIKPFHQPKRIVMDLYLKPKSKDATLSGQAARTLELERNTGSVKLDLKIRARVRFKVGGWNFKGGGRKLRDGTMKIDCLQVAANWAAGQGFKTKDCDVRI